MDPMLEKFFAEHEQNLQARRQQHREEVLRSLKLVKPCDGKKYYVDAETVRNAAPSQRAFFPWKRPTADSATILPLAAALRPSM